MGQVLQHLGQFTRLFPGGDGGAIEVGEGCGMICQGCGQAAAVNHRAANLQQQRPCWPLALLGDNAQGLFDANVASD